MTLKDLQRLISSRSDVNHSSPNNPKQILLSRLRNKPFWIWDHGPHKEKNRIRKGDCCFNHIIGLPKKDGIEKPLFPYEKTMYLALLRPDYLNSLTARPGQSAYKFKEKHLWVKKATGLGVTEFMLRLMAWLCLRNNDYQNSQMCIITGPNQDIAIKLIKRMKGLFEHKLRITFANKETVLELDGCSIEAYPSNHVMLIEHWIIPSSSFWMKQTSLESQNKKMSEMSLNVTLQSQIHSLLWYQLHILRKAYLKR